MSSEQGPRIRSTWPLFPPEVDLPEDAPFAHDQLGRKAEAEQLTIMLDHSPTPLVIGLDAAWGTGKTTFVKMWSRHLAKNGYKTVYFNAWETDFVTEPLIALVGEVGALLPASKRTAQATYEKLKTTTGLILKKATPIAARLLTAGLVELRPGDLQLSPEELEKALAETAEKVVEDAIDQYQRHRNEVSEFRKTLSKVVALAAGDRPLIFFIDELDRCRPTFAIELLERVKHLLEVQGIIFIFSIHREQLAHSLKAIYGQDFDAEGYLGRFFHLIYRLAVPHRRQYTEYLLREVRLSQSMVGSYLGFLMDYLCFTLREQQQCVARTALVLRIAGTGRDDPSVYGALLAIREWKPNLYAGFLRGDKTADDVLEALSAVDTDAWQLAAESRYIEEDLLRLESDRRETMRQSDKQPAWSSKRLQRHRDAASGGNEQSRSIVEKFDHYLKSTGIRDRRGHWRRILAALELGGKFQILDEEL